MAVNFLESATKENLMRAFAGESQARNRYTFAASQAKKANLHIIEQLFTYTAQQEKEHAEIFYHFLSAAAKENINISGGYPVDISDSIADLLQMAHHNEYEEYQIVYKQFGDQAKEEGFDSIAGTFYMIAGIEKIHGDRFARFADMLRQNQLFSADQETGWLCLNCGYVHTGKEAPKICPVCRHNQGYYIRWADSLFEN